MNSSNSRQGSLPISSRAAVGWPAFPGLSQQVGEPVVVNYVFFSEQESVVYTGPGPFVGRVFLLRFWRYAKDGVMHLLGYEHQGHWRDPTLCYPNSFVRYYKPVHHAAAAPRDSSATDSTQHRHRPGIEQLAYRVPMLELEPGVYELPTLHGKPPHVLESARVFPVRPHSVPTRRLPTNRLLLYVPLQKTIDFVALSAHFQKPQQAEKALTGILSVLRQFPQLKVTIQGNLAFFAVPKALTGFSATARADQDALFQTPAVTRWPTQVESYNSNGEVMDGRAGAIRQYLLSKGIAARRIQTMRGQYMAKRTVTIIFSN